MSKSVRMYIWAACALLVDLFFSGGLLFASLRDDSTPMWVSPVLLAWFLLNFIAVYYVVLSGVED